jgi:hypothetical protein
MRGINKSRTKQSPSDLPLLPDVRQRFFRFVLVRKKQERTMNNKNDVEALCQNHFDFAIGYYELGMLAESDNELSKIDPCDAAQSATILALRMAICFGRGHWNKMKALSQTLVQLDPSNPMWPYCDGFSTAKIDAMADKEV